MNVDGASYTNDDAGNRTSKQNLLTGVTENYTYDPIYQLTKVMQGANTTESYSYDRVGNRLNDVLTGNWQYNASNQLTSTASATFTYDNNGNMLTKSDTNGVTQYAWDYENRLTSVTLPNGGGAVTFNYDPLGRRIGCFLRCMALCEPNTRARQSLGVGYFLVGLGLSQQSLIPLFGGVVSHEENRDLCWINRVSGCDISGFYLVLRFSPWVGGDRQCSTVCSRSPLYLANKYHDVRR